MNTTNNIKTSVQLDVKDATKKLKLLETRINKIQTLIGSSGTTAGKFSRYIQKAAKDMQKLDNANNKAAGSANRLNQNYSKAVKTTNVLTKNVKALASTYIGLMGAQAVTKVSDTITSAENRLNNLNSGNRQLTQQQMDKMYNSAVSSRMGYGDMMANVSKSMTLAPDAFKGNIDNAIRFQEIMAKSYALGGASAAEQSSSMYQMIQALGSGILQGDELRSVREGAPLAYQAIEEFAKGVYGAEENLKDLASEGKITSEIVVAAMMNAGQDVADAFEQTDITFGQFATNIKSVATKAFEPTLQLLNDGLNAIVDSGVLNAIATGFQIIGGVLNLVFIGISKVYGFIVSNAELIKDALLTIGVVLVASLIPKIIAFGIAAGVALKTTLLHIMSDIAGFIMLAKAEGLAATMAGLFGITINWWLIAIIAVLAAVVIAVIWLSDSFEDACGNIVGALAWLGATMLNIVVGAINAIIQSYWTLFVAPFTGIIEWVVNAFGGGFDSISGAAANLFGQLISWLLDFGKIATKIIDAVFGTSTTDLVSGLQNTVKSWGKTENAVTWTLTAPQLKRVSTTEAFDSGYAFGYEKAQWATDKVSNALNLGGVEGLINPDNFSDVVGGVGDISDNTGKIAKTMELAEEDLEMLRDLAEMEWKKEFTGVNLKVDMSNYNTINNESDLEGWLAKLGDVLYEELDAVAYGVYEG